jgi:hypothetical protein
VTDHRAIARDDRVTIAHALHCHFIDTTRHPDQETLGVLLWIIKRFDMHNISQAPFSLPIGLWRAVDSVFPGEMILSERRAIRQLGEQFRAERASAKALDVIEEMMKYSGPRP